MKIFLTKLTHPLSIYDISWMSDLEVELNHNEIICTEILSSEYRVPRDWKPSVIEIILQKLYEYHWTTRYLKRPPRGGLSRKLHSKMILQHVLEIIGVVISPRFRRIRQIKGRRDLDISLAYLHFLPYLKDTEHKWTLHLEDDAQVLLPLREAASVIAKIMSTLDDTGESVWLADLSKSFSFDELGLSDKFFDLIEVETVKFARIRGRASNTFCALLVPTSTWINYLEYLQEISKRKGLRLIPCDWIFNDFAEKFPATVQEITLISEQGIFLQQSLHPA